MDQTTNIQLQKIMKDYVSKYADIAKAYAEKFKTRDRNPDYSSNLLDKYSNYVSTTSNNLLGTVVTTGSTAIGGNSGGWQTSTAYPSVNIPYQNATFELKMPPEPPPIKEQTFEGLTQDQALTFMESILQWKMSERNVDPTTFRATLLSTIAAMLGSKQMPTNDDLQCLVDICNGQSKASGTITSGNMAVRIQNFAMYLRAVSDQLTKFTEEAKAEIVMQTADAVKKGK